MMAVLGLCAAVVHNFIVSSQPVGREARGYRVSGAVVAIVMLLTAWTTFLGIKEKFQPKQDRILHVLYWGSELVGFHRTGTGGVVSRLASRSELASLAPVLTTPFRRASEPSL